MIRILILNILCLIFTINCVNAVLKKHPDSDFRPYREFKHYKQKEKSCRRFEYGGKEKCQCRRDKMNKMALVYFGRFIKNHHGIEMEEYERYLVSKEAMGSGSYSKVVVLFHSQFAYPSTNPGLSCHTNYRNE
jgi:hypothetical protein